jgi:hypothetical protein
MYIKQNDFETKSKNILINIDDNDVSKKIKKISLYELVNSLDTYLHKKNKVFL